MLAGEDCPKCKVEMWVGGERVNGVMVHFPICGICGYSPGRKAKITVEEHRQGYRSKTE